MQENDNVKRRLLYDLFQFASSSLNVKAEVYASKHCFTIRVTHSLNIIHQRTFPCRNSFGKFCLRKKFQFLIIKAMWSEQNFKRMISFLTADTAVSNT
jgi:hypothetical protein